MKAALLLQSGLLFVLPCERPPLEYQGESVPAVVYFAPPQVVDAICKRVAGIPPDSPRIILACANSANNTILLPGRADGSKGWVHTR